MKIRNKRNLLILSLKISTPFLRNNRYFSKDNDCLWEFLLLYMNRQAYCMNTHSGFIRNNEVASFERMNRLHTEQ